MNKLILLEDLGRMYPNEKSTVKARYGIFKCYCGNEFKTQITRVKNGYTKSCGCYAVEVIKKTNSTHKLTEHRLYKTWNSMMQRCLNNSTPSYKNYGARGITVCERWKDVSNFIEDMYSTYQEGLSIDRINPYGNYEPNNCRWADRTTQAQNTRLIHSTNKSGYRGVCWHSRDKVWTAQITSHKKHVHIGYYDTALEAAKAYDYYVLSNNLKHTINKVGL